jgi:hypothetical protein
MSAPISRKQLSAAGLLNKARRFFAKIPDPCDGKITLVDYLMSGLALFRAEVSFAAAIRARQSGRDHAGESARALRDRTGTKRHPLSRTSRCIRSEPVPRTQVRALTGLGSAAQVQQAARSVGIAAGIVVGRMQNEGWLRWSNLKKLKVRYEWT